MCGERVQGGRSNNMEQSYWSRGLNWTEGMWMRVCLRPIRGKVRTFLHGVLLEGTLVVHTSERGVYGIFAPLSTYDLVVFYAHSVDAQAH